MVIPHDIEHFVERSSMMIFAFPTAAPGTFSSFFFIPLFDEFADAIVENSSH
jgi:hypothetical protein